LKQHFAEWSKRDVIFVNAAGNQGIRLDSIALFPSNLNFLNTVTVGSVDRDKRRSTFSNYGSNVAVYAPGEDIVSLALYDPFRDPLIARSGTSMSTAFVTGALALAWSAYPQYHAADILRAFHRTVDAGHYQKGLPLLNIGSMLTELDRLTGADNPELPSPQ
jgi:subtilisin family serine protease